VIIFKKLILIIFILMISSCSSLAVLKKTYQNLMPDSLNSFYVVQRGDSLWSIALKFNLDAELLIANNNLKKPYIIYPNQKLLLDGKGNKRKSFEQPEAIQWHHPLIGKSKPATKDDAWLVFKEPKGMPIHSINSGKVVVSGPDIPGYGNLVIISHSDGYLSLYAHCDKIFVQQGDEVIKGAMIARLGNSEASYPMLRFQLRKNGKPIKAEKLNSLF
jgi:lipoprotein NlpD